MSNQAGKLNMKVYYTILLERYLPDIVVNSIMDIMSYCAPKGALLIQTTYARTDHRRQKISEIFMENSQNDDDVLIMLDNDHVHPGDIVGRLVRYPDEYGVVAALAYMRGEPYRPLFFNREENGELSVPIHVGDKGLLPVTIAAPCAMAIRRWVFQKLLDNGEKLWWKYTYEEKKDWWGEDMYFGELCERYGIRHYVDLETLVPHITYRLIGREDWENADHELETRTFSG